MRLWQYKGLSKVVALTQNVYQFIFLKAEDRKVVMNGRPWFFVNLVLILQPWKAELSWTDKCFTVSPFWIQVRHIPPHWLLLDTGQKIDNILGTVKDVILIKSGGKEDRHLNVQVDLNLTKPFVRGTKLRYKNTEAWIEFKYEQLLGFCYYCGVMRYGEKICLKRKQDVENKCVLPEQFGGWMRANSRRPEGGKVEGLGWELDVLDLRILVQWLQIRLGSEKR